MKLYEVVKLRKRPLIPLYREILVKDEIRSRKEAKAIARKIRGVGVEVRQYERLSPLLQRAWKKLEKRSARK